MGNPEHTLNHSLISVFLYTGRGEHTLPFCIYISYLSQICLVFVKFLKDANSKFSMVIEWH